jgi:hypothetical protein
VRIVCAFIGFLMCGQAHAEGVVFDCAPFVPRELTACRRARADDPAVRLLAAAQELPRFLALHVPPEARWSALRRAVDGATALDPASETVPERVQLQNAALRIAVYAGHERPTLTGAALRLVERLALPAATLNALGEEPTSGLERWIGPASTWRVKDRRGRATLHGSLHQEMRYFRPVQAGQHRVIFSQLLAVDSTGHPHLTPFCGELEARYDRAVDASACVAEVELGALRCGAPVGLRPVDASAHPATHLFHLVAFGRVGCPSCHGARSAFNLPEAPPADAAALVTAEKREALERAKAALAKLRDVVKAR